jgi:rhomboid protease GluP
MSEAIFDPRGENVYEAKRSKSCRFGMLLIVIALAAGWAAVQAFIPWFNGGALPKPLPIFMLAISVPLFGVGVMGFINALRGLPRLTVMRDGVELETLFGTKWANWDSLSAFELTAVNRRVTYASSAIVGAAVSGNLQRKKKLTIPDAFLAPIETIFANLHAHQARRLGISHPLAVPAAKARDEARFGVADFSVPWLTFSILLLLVITFIGEQIYAIDASGAVSRRPSLVSLVALGGLNRTLVFGHGEWYRIFTAPLLHGDPSHIFFNGLALVMAGYQLERLVGRLWFFALFVIGALGGAMFSLMINPANVTSVGASGAIMGLFGAAYMSSFRLPIEAKERWRMQIRSAFVLIPSLGPLATSAAAGHVDYGAHLGGMLAGALSMALLLRAWPETSPLPMARSMAVAVASLGLVLMATGFAEVANYYPTYQTLGALIPAGEVPKDQREGKVRAIDLTARYPLDPRGHMYRGLWLIDAHDFAAAERELRLATRQAGDFRFFFGGQLENTQRALLAVVLFHEGKHKDAKEIAGPVCQASPDDRAPQQLLAILVEQHLCDG